MRLPGAPVSVVLLLVLLAGCEDAPAQGSRAAASHERDRPAAVLVSRSEPRPILPFSAGLGHRLAEDTVLLLDHDGARAVIHHVRGDSTITAFGSEGEGPGQFLLPVAATRDGDGRLVVADGRQLRLTWWSPEGKAVASRPLRHWPLGLWSVGDSLMALWTPFVPGKGPAFGLLDTASTRPLSEQPVFEIVPQLAESRPGEPPSGFLGLARCPDGSLVLGNGRAYLLARVSVDGALMRTFGRPDQPSIMRTEQELQDLRRMMEGMLASLPASAVAGLDERMERMSKTPKPFFGSGLTGDARGRIWVPTTRGRPDSTAIDVFRCTGEFLGSFMARDAVRALSVAGSTLVALVRRTGAEYLDQNGIDVYDIAHAFE